MAGSRGYIAFRIGCAKPTLRNSTVFFKGLDYMRKDKDSSASAARAVMVMQIGARRNYFGARQLEAAGLLHSLVCDAAWPADQLSWLARLAPQVKPRLASAIKRRCFRIWLPSVSSSFRKSRHLLSWTKRSVWLRA